PLPPPTPPSKPDRVLPGVLLNERILVARGVSRERADDNRDLYTGSGTWLFCSTPGGRRVADASPATAGGDSGPLGGSRPLDRAPHKEPRPRAALAALLLWRAAEWTP